MVEARKSRRSLSRSPEPRRDSDNQSLFRIQVKIVKLCDNGFGIGHHDDKTVFVTNTLPGELIEAEVTASQTAIIYARPIRIIESAEQRQEPDCEAFGHLKFCGACDWLMLSYDGQIETKLDSFRYKYNNLAPTSTRPLSIIPSPLTRQYRNRSCMPVAQDDNGITFGMYQRWSHQVVAHRQCLLHPPVFDEIGRVVMDWAQKAKVAAYDEINHSGVLRHICCRISEWDGSILLILVTRGAKLPFSNLFVKTIREQFPQVCGIIQNINRRPGNVILGDEEKILWGVPYLREVLSGIRLRVHYRSFLQVNGKAATLMYDYISGLIEAEDRIVDAYCGIGSIALSIADRARQVTGIEEVPAAIEDAIANAQMNDITNARFICGKVERILPELIADRGYDTIIFDPPRKGLDAGLLPLLDPTLIRKVIYVSCQPITLFRDLYIMKELGYEVESIQLFDMFPQTAHLEAVALLRSVRKPE